MINICKIECKMKMFKILKEVLKLLDLVLVKASTNGDILGEAMNLCYKLSSYESRRENTLMCSL
jgi:hypothetical protein